MPSSDRDTSPSLRRRLAEVATLIVLLYVLQAGLFPFNFTTDLPPGSSRVYFSVDVHDLLIPDIVSNIILYLPVGWCCAIMAVRRLGNSLTALLCALLIGSAASLFVEFGQAFLPTRVSSMIDLTANVCGTFVGGLLGVVMHWAAPRMLAAFITEFRASPLAACTKAYAIILVVLAAVPFTFTFDVAGVYRAARRAYLTPFAALHDARARAYGEVLAQAGGQRTQTVRLPGVPTEPRALAAFRAWQWHRMWARWGAGAASFFVLGVLIGLVLRNDFGFTPRTAAALTMWMCGGLALLLSVLDLFLVTRTPDVTDVLFRLFGAGAAIISVSLWLRTSADRRSVIITRLERLSYTILCAVGAYVLYTGLIPFRFEWTLDRMFRSLTSIHFLPFASYDAARFDVALADLTEKTVVWMLLAATLALTREWRFAQVPQPKNVPFASSIPALCTGVSLLIETLQLFSPVRTASLTDPILAGVASAVGLALYRRVVDVLRHARAFDRSEPAVAVRRPDPPLMSPTDELIASLIDEHADAPVEDVPQPQREES